MPDNLMPVPASPSPSESSAPATPQLQLKEAAGEGQVPVSKFLVRAIRVTGNTNVTTEEIAPLFASYLGSELGMVELQKIMDAITGLYQQKGFLLTKVYLPPQDIVNNEIEIRVLEGKIGEVKIEAGQYYSTAFVRNHFAEIDLGQRVQHNMFERSLLTLNRYPDLKVGAQLQEGAAFGTADVAIRLEEKRPVHVTLEYNNFGSKVISRDRYGVGVDFGQFILEGSNLSIRGTVLGSRDMAFSQAGYIAPVGYKGTRVNLSYAAGDFDLGQELAILNIEMKSRTVGLSVTHPCIRKPFFDLVGEVGLDIKDFDQTTFGVTSGSDQVRVLKAGVSAETTDTLGGRFVSAYLHQGLNDLLGGMDRHSRFSSRSEAGADGLFTRATVQYVRSYQNIASPGWLPSPVSLVTRGGLQVTSHDLVVGEQYSVGGPGSVRGYPAGEFFGDHGYNLGAEFGARPFQNLPSVQTVFFVDHGGGYLKSKPSGARQNRSLTGAGIGFRMHRESLFHWKKYQKQEEHFLPYRASLQVDLGFPIAPRPASTRKDVTFYIQAVSQF